jgi:hypothetical protein
MSSLRSPHRNFSITLWRIWGNSFPTSPPPSGFPNFVFYHWTRPSLDSTIWKLQRVFECLSDQDWPGQASHSFSTPTVHFEHLVLLLNGHGRGTWAYIRRIPELWKNTHLTSQLHHGAACCVKALQPQPLTCWQVLNLGTTVIKNKTEPGILKAK